MSESDSIAEAIARYLRDGTHEHDHHEWPGNLWDRAKKSHDDLLEALVNEVQRRADERTRQCRLTSTASRGPGER